MAWLAIRDYSRLALALVGLVLVTGTVQAVLLVPPGAVFTTAYGWTLVAKVALVAVVLGLAVAGRWRLRRDDRAHPPWIPARREGAMLGAVLAVTALLTTLAPARVPQPALPFPPPASGPVIPLGTRAGQIGVHVAASASQLLVHLTAPEIGNTSTDTTTGSSGTTLTATLTPPGQPTRAAAFRACGPGCYVAAVTWTPGTTQLTLRATADTWNGATVGLAVPWPPTPDPQALTALATALTAVPAFSVYERVSSDTTHGLGNTVRTDLSGAQFLAAEPYAAGHAAETIRLPAATPGAGPSLLLGYPAENIEIRLDLTPTGLPLRETETTPDELTTRTFAYPEP